jgi:hypothetical protein
VLNIVKKLPRCSWGFPWIFYRLLVAAEERCTSYQPKKQSALHLPHSTDPIFDKSNPRSTNNLSTHQGKLFRRMRRSQEWTSFSRLIRTYPYYPSMHDMVMLLRGHYLLVFVITSIHCWCFKNHYFHGSLKSTHHISAVVKTRYIYNAYVVYYLVILYVYNIM